MSVNFLSIPEAVKAMNDHGAAGEPFLFLVDFRCEKSFVCAVNRLPGGILFSTPLLGNAGGEKQSGKVLLTRNPVSFDVYQKAFNNVQRNIKLGNSYLVNLTFPTPVSSDLSISEIFRRSVAKYRLNFFDRFIVFSPEIFVRISGSGIFSYPMKGTIDASVRDAENVILNDRKEKAEHDTIVDLIRNDLSIIADNVKVLKYRYIDRIVTATGELLQVSSEIGGQLPEGFNSRLGDILFSLLPAGSVTGAPKKETVRIITESEICERGWYTGVFGVFDGKSLDSCVMIRFIENNNGRLVFRSGGGITSLSDPVKEYEELIAKVYVPAG